MEVNNDNLVLNFIPVKVKGESLKAYVSPFESTKTG